jgi:hypothetical protein
MGKKKYDNFYHHNRNYGCRYHEVIYRGFKTLVIENEKLRISVLVDKGTDIVELLYKPMDIDFMWRSPVEVDGLNKNPFSKEMDSGAFLDVYEGGWQELLPSITSPTNYKGMGLGFHGEVLLLPWNYHIVEDSPYELKVKFQVRMRRTPFFVIKYLTLRSDSSVIEFEETVENEGDEEFKFMWGHHPAIGKPFLDENCVIDLPEPAVGQIYQVDFSGNSPFKPDTEFKWPNIKDKDNNMVDLSRVMSPEKKTAFNMYVKNLKAGWYGLTNLKKHVGFGMKWDIEVFKYMLIWSVYRGFYNFPFYGRTYNIALELYSAIPDSLEEVIKLNRAICLKPGEKIGTKFQTIVYETDKRIKGFNENNEILTK